MDPSGERSNGAALGPGHRPPAKAWRGGGAAPAPPPRVYSVEPRDFRELVQRLTGAGSTATDARQRVTLASAMAAENTGRVEAAKQEQFDYSSWFSAPLLSPAYVPAGFDGRHGSGALL